MTGYTIRIRIGDEPPQTLSFSSKGRMITASHEYTERGYIVAYPREQ